MRFRITLAPVLAGAALALPSAALASPTPPVVHPVPSTVMVAPGVVNSVGWEPSTFDALSSNAVYAYDVRIARYLTGSTPSTTWSFPYLSGCCSYALDLVPGYHYLVSVRAHEWVPCSIVGRCHESWSLWRTVQFDALGLPSADF